MHFIIRYILITLFGVSTLIAQKNDSLNQKCAWYINTYPSALVTGDFSIGTEFNYKRIRQEVAFFYKTFNVLDKYNNYYLFDKGYRFNYYLKYNIVKRKNHLLSFDIGYSYRERAFNNKNTHPDLYKSLVDVPSSEDFSTYNLDRKQYLQGISIGFSNIFKVYKKLNMGFNLNYDLLKVNTTYTLNYYVSGGQIIENYTTGKELQTPYTNSYNYIRSEIVSLLIKVIYKLN